MITIENSRPQDAEEICLLIKESISVLCALDHDNDSEKLGLWLHNKTPVNIERWMLNNRSLSAFGALDSIVGVSMLSADGEILLNYVSPENVGEGVGRALMKAMENSCEKGSKLRVESTKSALGFYQHMGFTPLSGRTDTLEKTVQ